MQKLELRGQVHFCLISVNIDYSRRFPLQNPSNPTRAGVSNPFSEQAGLSDEHSPLHVHMSLFECTAQISRSLATMHTPCHFVFLAVCTVLLVQPNGICPCLRITHPSLQSNQHPCLCVSTHARTHTHTHTRSPQRSILRGSLLGQYHPVTPTPATAAAAAASGPSPQP